MKVLHVIDNLAPGGAERVMVNACNWLHEAGVAVEAVIISGQSLELMALLDPHIQIHVLGRRSRLDIQAARRLAELLAEEVNIAHVHMRHNFRYTALIAKLFHIRTPLVFHDHYGTINLDQRIPAGFGSFARPQWYIGVSKTLTTWAERQLHLLPEQIFLLENAVAAEPFVDAPLKRNLVLVSNIKAQKNQLFALELLQRTGLSLDIYGARQDEGYAKELEAAIQNKSLAGQVRLFHDCHNVQSRLGGYQLGLHTSNSETGPLAVIEYLAQGLPFLAYRTGAAADLIGRDFPEFFIDCFEPEAWAERIRQLLAAPPDRARMAEVFERHFSKKRYVEQCLEIYKRILAS